MKLTIALLASIISFSTLAQAAPMSSVDVRLSNLEKLVQIQQRQISRLENKVRLLESSGLTIAPTPIREVDPSQVCKVTADVWGNLSIVKNGATVAKDFKTLSDVTKTFANLVDAAVCTLGGAEKCDISTDVWGKSQVVQSGGTVTGQASSMRAIEMLKELRQVGACQ